MMADDNRTKTNLKSILYDWTVANIKFQLKCFPSVMDDFINLLMFYVHNFNIDPIYSITNPSVKYGLRQQTVSSHHPHSLTTKLAFKKNNSKETKLKHMVDLTRIVPNPNHKCQCHKSGENVQISKHKFEPE